MEIIKIITLQTKHHMIRNITQNELILLAYNELPPDKHSEVLRAVNSDKTLNEQYIQIKNDFSILDTVAYKPNPTSIQIIKEQSCSSSPMEMI
ncbi:hypothetical protein N9811_03205 [Bacteroidia bacterium]|nr:hypothetical protein [Bacteroidia bacterium]